MIFCDQKGNDRPRKVGQVEKHHGSGGLNRDCGSGLVLRLELLFQRRVRLGVVMIGMILVAAFLIGDHLVPMSVAVVRGHFYRLPGADAHIVVIEPRHLRPAHRDEREEEDAEVGEGLVHDG